MVVQITINIARTLVKRKKSRKRKRDDTDTDRSMRLPIKRLHQSIRGENHGKGVGDAFNATGKGSFTRHEKRDENSEEKATTSHINDASDCVRVLSRKRSGRGKAGKKTPLKYHEKAEGM